MNDIAALVKSSKSSRKEFVLRQYELYAQGIFHKCLRLGKNFQWAEDVTHDVFIRLMEKVDELDENKNIEGWLHTVAYRCCLDRLQREHSIWERVKRALPQVRENDVAQTPETIVLTKHELTRVVEALVELPPRQRVVFVMKYLENMSQQEISQALGLSKGFVSKLIHRAVEHIRRQGWELDHV